MRLKAVFESLFAEIDPAIPPEGSDMPPESVPPPDQQAEPDGGADPETIIELPNQNMTVVASRSKKTLLFVPQFHTSLTNKVRTYVNTLKQNFMVLGVSSKEDGAFEISFDPRENFDSVLDQVHDLSQLEKEFNEKF